MILALISLPINLSDQPLVLLFIQGQVVHSKHRGEQTSYLHYLPFERSDLQFRLMEISQPLSNFLKVGTIKLHK